MQEQKSEIKKIKLTPRLKKVAELVTECDTVADIGTDHAYIPAFLVETGKARRAIASDIVEGPVARAAATVRAHGLRDRIDVRCGAGLETVKRGEAEVIVIAGMGGILISEILEKSRSVTDSAKLLILQPMTAVTELREYLRDSGYTAGDEYLVREEHRIYNIVTAVSGGKTEYTVKELYLGKNTEDTSPDLFEEYKKRVSAGLNKRAEGLKKSLSGGNDAVIARLAETIKEIG